MLRFILRRLKYKENTSIQGKHVFSFDSSHRLPVTEALQLDVSGQETTFRWIVIVDKRNH